MIRKLMLSAAATALAVSSVAVQAAPAARTSAPVSAEQEELAGGFLLPVLFALAVGLGIFLLVDDSDEPVSP